MDDFWHQHILDTRKYRDDSETVFGYYMDHTPSLSPKDQEGADAKRRQVYIDHDVDSTWFDSGDAGSADGGLPHHAHGSHAGDGHGCEVGGHDSGAGHASGESSGTDGGAATEVEVVMAVVAVEAAAAVEVDDARRRLLFEKNE